MYTPSDILKSVREPGRVNLGGELEFDLGLTCGEAFKKLHEIACECGHAVSRMGWCRLQVTPYYGHGYFVLDWSDSDRPGPWRVSLWQETSAQVSVTRDKDGTIEVSRGDLR